MNIARSLDKPAVPRSKKRRRIRRIKLAFHLVVLLIFLSSAALAAYWTVVGIGMLWRAWGSPAAAATWTWLQEMSPAERFMWLNRLGWVAVGIGMLTSLWVYVRGSRFAKRLTLLCFTYCYAFLWYIVWLAIQSFVDMNGWTENGMVGLAVVGYVCIIGQTRMAKSMPSREKAS